MANDRYTSLSDLLDAHQRRTPFVSHDSEYYSDNYSFPLATEMFGELCFRERSLSSRSSGLSIWDLFTPPLPPPRPLPNFPLDDPAEVQGLNKNSDPNQVLDLNESSDPQQVLALNENESSPSPDVEEENKTDEFKKILAQNNCCKYGNYGKLFPPPLSTLKMNRAGEPLVFLQFDEDENDFVQKQLFLPEGVMAASRPDGRLRMSLAYDFADDEEAPEKKKENSSDEVEEEVAPVLAANGAKPGDKPQA